MHLKTVSRRCALIAYCSLLAPFSSFAIAGQDRSLLKPLSKQLIAPQTSPNSEISELNTGVPADSIPAFKLMPDTGFLIPGKTAEAQAQERREARMRHFLNTHSLPDNHLEL